MRGRLESGACFLQKQSVMSPTVFRKGGLRFFFFSREESRVHVHVASAGGEAKIWLDPEVALAENRGLGPAQLSKAIELTRKHEAKIRQAWASHFGR